MRSARTRDNSINGYICDQDRFDKPRKADARSHETPERTIPSVERWVGQEIEPKMSVTRCRDVRPAILLGHRLRMSAQFLT
jgi:hypothetical protein